MNRIAIIVVLLTTPLAAQEQKTLLTNSELKWKILRDDEVSIGFMILHDGTMPGHLAAKRVIETWHAQGFDWDEFDWGYGGLHDLTTNREHGWRAQFKQFPIVVMIKKDQVGASTYSPCSLKLPATIAEFESWRLRTCTTAHNRPSGTREERESWARRMAATQSRTVPVSQSRVEPLFQPRTAVRAPT